MNGALPRALFLRGQRRGAYMCGRCAAPPPPATAAIVPRPPIAVANRAVRTTGRGRSSSSSSRPYPDTHRSPQRRLSLSTFARGHDLLYESLTFGAGRRMPKVILQGYGPTGFDVSNVLKKVGGAGGSGGGLTAAEALAPQASGTIHMNGSVLAFPHGCFLWRVESPADVTLESLAPVLLYRDPSPLEYLFLGAENADGVPAPEFARIRDAMRRNNTVVERLNLANAIGTFNILNAEDRQVAVALVVDRDAGGDDGGEED